MNGTHRMIHLDVWIQWLISVTGTNLMSTCRSEMKAGIGWKNIDGFYDEVKL